MALESILAANKKGPLPGENQGEDLLFYKKERVVLPSSELMHQR
jgi:hypothetical protein